MNWRKIINILIAIMVGMIVMANIYYTYKAKRIMRQYEEMKTVVDTTKQIPPVPKDSIIIKYKIVTLPAAPTKEEKVEEEKAKEEIAPKDTLYYLGDSILNRPTPTPKPDSTNVILPITQKEYRDSLYCAWVSGYDAQLDSIELYYPKPAPVYDPMVEWSLGLQAGVGWFGDGFKPYIGVGIQLGIDLRKIKAQSRRRGSH